MKLLRCIVSLVLALAISSSGIPVNMIEDVSRNGVVGLEDAIMQVQDLAQSPSSTAGFEFNFENLLNTLSAVAGLKNLVNPNKESKSSKHQVQVAISLDKITNSFSLLIPPLLSSTGEYPEHSVVYASRPLDASTPPPRFA
jgi:hypothetical protein